MTTGLTNEHRDALARRVVERLRTDMADEDNHPAHVATNADGTCSDPACPCHEFSRKDSVQLSFDSLWSRTPLVIQESAEKDICEYFYRMGVIHGREMVPATTNDDLVEMRRLAGERLR